LVYNLFIKVSNSNKYHNQVNIERLINQSEFTKNEILNLLNLEDDPGIKLLLEKAEQIERICCDSSINSYGLIEISTFCSENCNYCRLRKDNYSIIRERMNRERIIEIAKEINKSGIESIVIRSGYDDFYDVDRISYIIYSIKKHADVEIMLSLGERTLEEYKEWKLAGANGYRLRFKSSNPNIYNSLNSYGSIESRLKHIELIKSLGLKICSGSIFGLPKQSVDDIAEDLQLIQTINLDIAEFLPFYPQNHTPYEYSTTWNYNNIKKTNAVAILALQKIIRCSKPKYVFNLEGNLVN